MGLGFGQKVDWDMEMNKMWAGKWNLHSPVKNPLFLMMIVYNMLSLPEAGLESHRQLYMLPGS